MVALEFIRTYLDDFLCITKPSLDDHLDHLRLILIRFQEERLKINVPKLKFCAEDTEYLGYILTRTGIKPQPKKVQVILAKTQPKQVKDLRSFLGMVWGQLYGTPWLCQTKQPNFVRRSIFVS
jgi:hypothetical protein